MFFHTTPLQGSVVLKAIITGATASCILVVRPDYVKSNTHPRCKEIQWTFLCEKFIFVLQGKDGNVEHYR